MQKQEAVHRFMLSGRACAAYVPEGEIQHLLFLCGWHMEEFMPTLADVLPHTLLFAAEADGGADFTPWPAPAVWEGEPFSGRAADYLAFLTETALPALKARWGLVSCPANTGIAGYSLGGLFALWAACKSGGFGRVMSLSGSTWYPGFAEYIKANPPPDHTKFYLSLGDREPFGGPAVLRQVGVCTENLVGFLRDAGYDTTFEWNRGGHGKGIENRWKKALHWAAERWKESGAEI